MTCVSQDGQKLIDAHRPFLSNEGGMDVGVSLRHDRRPQLPDQPMNSANRQQDEKNQQHYAGQAD